MTYPDVPTATVNWAASRTGDSSSYLFIDGSVADEDGTEHYLLPRKGGGKGGGKGGKGKSGKGQRGKNRDTGFGKAFEGFKNAKSAIIGRLRLLGRKARMLARASDSTTSADLPSDKEVRDNLNKLKVEYLSELGPNQSGDEGHYKMILESLDAAILEAKVAEFLSKWDATVAWLEGEQESGSTETRPLSATYIVWGSAAVGLAAGSFFGGSFL